MNKLMAGVDAIGEVCLLTVEVGKTLLKGPFEWDLISRTASKRRA